MQFMIIPSIEILVENRAFTNACCINEYGIIFAIQKLAPSLEKLLEATTLIADVRTMTAIANNAA